MSSFRTANDEQHLSPINEDEDALNAFEESPIRYGSYIQSDTETENLLRRSQSTPIANTLLSSSSSNHKTPSLKLSKSVDHVSDSHNRSNISTPRIRPRRFSHVGPTLFRAKSFLEATYLPPPEPAETGYYTVNDAINEMGMGKFQWFLWFILGLLSCAYAMEVMLVAILLPVFQKHFKITPVESTLVPLASIIGAFVGAFVLSLLSDKYGRRKIIIVGVLCTAISAMVSAFATDIWQESIARYH